MDVRLWLVDRDERARFLDRSLDRDESVWTRNSKGKMEREVTGADAVLAGEINKSSGNTAPLFFTAEFECHPDGGVAITSFSQRLPF